MIDPRPDRTLKALLELEADAFPTRPDASAPQDVAVESWLPSLDERVEMFLEAVHGAEHEYTAQARAAARERILSAMASDLAEPTSTSLPADRPEPAPQAVAARSADRVPGILGKLAAGFRQAVAAGGEAFTMRGMRMAAVPLVAVLAVGSIWGTRSIYFGRGPEQATTTRLPDAGAEVPAPVPSPPATRGLAPSPEAEEALRRRIFSAESALGPSHPDIAEMLANLAALYQFQRRHVEAEALYERALAIRERALGPGHPELAATLNKLAEVYRARGRLREAQDLSDRAAAISKP